MYIISYHIIYPIVSYIISYHIISYHITSHHIIYHIIYHISYHIILYYYITLKCLHPSVCFIACLISLMQCQGLSRITVTFFLNWVIPVWTGLGYNSSEESNKLATPLVSNTILYEIRNN